MIYAYVQNGVVLEVERRTEQYPNDPSPLQHFYSEGLIPFFIPVPNEIKDQIRRGWVHSHADGFHEPKPFEINPETGEMYLPAGIPAETFWIITQENIRLQNEVQQLTEVVDSMLIESLTEKGVLLSD